MAVVDEAVKARLDAYAGLSALVSTRNYAERLPQAPTYPANRFHRLGVERHHAMGSDATVRDTRFQISTFATSYSAAMVIGVQVAAAVSRWRGTQANGVVIQDTLIETQIGPFWDSTISTNGGYHMTTDVVVFHEGD